MICAPTISIRIRSTRTIGFKPRHTVEDAIRELCVAFREGKLPGSLEDDKYFNVQRMKALNAA